MHHRICQLVSVRSDKPKIVAIGGINGTNSHHGSHERNFRFFYKLAYQVKSIAQLDSPANNEDRPFALIQRLGNFL